MIYTSMSTNIGKIITIPNVQSSNSCVVNFEDPRTISNDEIILDNYTLNTVGCTYVTSEGIGLTQDLESYIISDIYNILLNRNTYTLFLRFSISPLDLDKDWCYILGASNMNKFNENKALNESGVTLKYSKNTLQAFRGCGINKFQTDKMSLNTTQTYHKVFIIYDGNYFYLKYNNQTSSVLSNRNSESSNLILGTLDLNAPTRLFFSGIISTFLIYDKVLTPIEQENILLNWV